MVNRTSAISNSEYTRYRDILAIISALGKVVIRMFQYYEHIRNQHGIA